MAGDVGESWPTLEPGLRCVIDAPSSWLSLVRLRPRRARRRFTSQSVVYPEIKGDNKRILSRSRLQMG